MANFKHQQTNFILCVSYICFDNVSVYTMNEAIFIFYSLGNPRKNEKLPKQSAHGTCALVFCFESNHSVILLVEN